MYRHVRPVLSATSRLASRRHASTTASPIRRSIGTVALLGGSVALVAYYYDSRSLIHEHVIMPTVRALTDAEESHRLAVRMLSMGAWARPKDKVVDDERLGATLWGKNLDNPIGVAAGFDKDAEAIDGQYADRMSPLDYYLRNLPFRMPVFDRIFAGSMILGLFDLGFGYVEVGSVTPEPQPGNPKPRFFRLPEDDAVINRYGFNSAGHRHTLHRLQDRLRAYADDHPSQFPSYDPTHPLSYRTIIDEFPSGLPKSLRLGRLLAVNLGKNKSSKADDHSDYVKGVEMLGPYADVLVINVSSPNTPGLRGLQHGESLSTLLTSVISARDGLKGKKEEKAKVVVKIAPDLDEEEIEGIARAVRGSGVEGVIVSNTTIKREGLGLISAHQHETGGLSGPPVKPLALLAVKTLRPLLPPSIPIIGCGGISSGSDALEYAQAGASLVQAYTAFGYAGVGFPRKIKDDLVDSFENKSVRGASSWGQVVKSAQDEWSKGVEHVSKDLLGQAGKWGEIIKQGESYVPWEDLVAERGMGKTDDKKGSKPKAIPFGETGPRAPSKDSPFAPADAGGKGVVPAVTKQLTDFLGRAQQVIGQDHARSAAAIAPSTTTPASTSATPPSLRETLETGSGRQAHEPEDTRPAVQRENAQLAWVSEVTRGSRRLV